MCVNIITLQSFYKSLLGQRVKQDISAALECYYSSTSGERIIGLGYAVPYLDLFVQNAECCLAFMPAHQGASLWPTVEIESLWCMHWSIQQMLRILCENYGVF